MSDLWEIPDEARASLIRYREQRTPTGSFLHAVLSNDLREAVARADDINIRCIPGIVRWIYHEVPGNAWGSPDRVTHWLNGDDA